MSKNLHIAGVVIATLLMAGGGRLHAESREWTLMSRTLAQRTTQALQRYYSIVQPDSLSVRYLRVNAPGAAYRLRASPATGESPGQLLSIRLGQLLLTSPGSIHIALGEELYDSLLGSRFEPGAGDHQIADDTFGHDLWNSDTRAIIALDRLDYRLAPSVCLFAAAGAPESNLYFWGDGTARVGVESPDWELGLLLPYAGGATPVGPIRERLLAPGYGAAGEVRIGALRGRARFTTVAAASVEAISVAPAAYVHSLSGEIRYGSGLTTSVGNFRGDIGIGYEEFTRVEPDGNGSVRAAGHVTRLSPVAEISWSSAQRNLQVRFGVVDIALRAIVTARLSESLWVEASGAANEVLRDRKAFEHSFVFFITPRLRF